MSGVPEDAKALAPCPFCGETEALSVSVYDIQPDDYHGGFVTCSECDAQGSNGISLNGWLSNKIEAEVAAIDAWNRAARPAVKPEPLAREEMIREDERDRLYRKANADYIAAEGRRDKIAEDLHSTAAFWLGENGGKSEAERAAESQRSRATTGEAKHSTEGNYVTNVERYPG